MRLANFAMPATKNTYAEDIADDLRPGTVVASLAEFAPRLADRGLYAPQGIPAFGLEDLDPRAVQRRLRRTLRPAAVLLGAGASVQPVRDRARRRRAAGGRAGAADPVARSGGGTRVIAAGWILAAVLGAVLVWLGLALAGAVRGLAALRERVDALEAASAPIHLDDRSPDRQSPSRRGR